MMKQSSILKWAQNGNKSNNTVKQTTSKNNWIHPPDALQRGHVAYLVKVGLFIIIKNCLLEKNDKNSN